MGVLAVAGVASIMPFMAVVGNPDIVSENRWLRMAYDRLGFQSTDGFLFGLGILTLLVIAISNGTGAFNAWVVARFQNGLVHEVSCSLFEKYLDQSYAFYLGRNSSALVKNVLSEVAAVVNGVVAPLIQLMAQTVVSLFILALLVWVDVVLALIVSVVIGGIYAAIYRVVRRQQSVLGRERLETNTLRYRAAAEAFGGIKDVKVLGREASFLQDFRHPSLRFARTNATHSIISQVPRYALETVAFGGILVIVLYLLQTYQDLGQVLPIVTLYAFAAYRLMPAFQVIFVSLTKVRFNVATLEDLHDDMVGGRMEREREDALAHHSVAAAAEDLVFERELRLEDVTFTYPGASRPALSGISFSIPKNSTVGLVGQTGSGKTTLADLLLGLFRPDGGELRVDGQVLAGDTLFKWRRRIGYVPQQIFLADKSIRRNIAFGIPEAQIDESKVQRAARIAHLDEFVESLPDTYETVVGDRGVRLSGGQRQRVGIARALYDDPDVLVMDEATSALDNVTESAVMDAIRELSGKKTMVLIAHRLTTVEHCDRIVMLEHGRLVGAGTYRELESGNSAFRAMTGSGADAAASTR